jgi:asparagine N-glycosylation enzyme membrane subunit Stt3
VVGVTDASGNFKYNPGDTVTFKIGNVVLGQSPADKVVTPQSLLADNATDPTIVQQKALMIASLLLTLDSNPNDNVIQIDERLKEKLENLGIEIDFEKDDDTTLQNITLDIDDDGNVEDMYSIIQNKMAEAKAHIEENLYNLVNQFLINANGQSVEFKNAVCSFTFTPNTTTTGTTTTTTTTGTIGTTATTATTGTTTTATNTTGTTTTTTDTTATSGTTTTNTTTQANTTTKVQVGTINMQCNDGMTYSFTIEKGEGSLDLTSDTGDVLLITKAEDDELCFIGLNGIKECIEIEEEKTKETETNQEINDTVNTDNQTE